MSLSTTFPQDAVCKGCGYLLRDLPGVVCPECGRGFDREDPRSFDRSSRVFSRRRWVARAAMVMILVLILGAVCPWGVMHGTITMTCQVCGTVVEAQRWELRPPPWVPFRYPGSASTATPKVPASPCAAHTFGHSVSLESPICKASASGVAQGTPATLNGRTLTPQTAESVLADLMHPSNNGIGP